MRTEPPVDQTFITATLILDLVDPARTALINDPGGLRACSEHLFPLRFPDLIPPTIVTADERAIRSFLAEHQTAVIKPSMASPAAASCALTAMTRTWGR